MKALYTRRTQEYLAKKYDIAVVFSVILAFLVYFSIPTTIREIKRDTEGTIESIKLEREARWSRTPFSKGYREYYDLMLQNEEGNKSFRIFSKNQIDDFGLQNFFKQFAKIRYNHFTEYNVVTDLIIDDVVVFKTKDIDYFPFLLFVGLFIACLVWSIWGFYLTYLVSDEKRKQILG